MLSCSVTPCCFKLLLLHFAHAELKTPWSQVHPWHHRAHVQRVHGIVFVLGLEQRLLSVLVRQILPTVVDMAVEHGLSAITSVPGVEWIVRQNKPCTIPQVLLLVVLNLHELISEVVVIEELIVVVSQNQVLLPLQVLQDGRCCLHVMH